MLTVSNQDLILLDTIVQGQAESDQAGSTTSDIKRIFANPFKPDICPILKLAVYVLCTRRTEASESMRLFEGSEQNKIYYNIFVKTLKDIPDHVDLGCNRDDIIESLRSQHLFQR